MDITNFFSIGSTHSQFDEEKGPEDVHSVEDKSQTKQISVLKVDNIPLIGWGWFVYIDVGQQAEREDNDTHIDPDCHN